jgi:transcriptional antiterminator NusG
MLSKVDRRILNDAFVPRRESARHVSGEWITVQETLFPGYVFAETSHPDKLSGSLRAVPLFTKLLKSDCAFIPLDRGEAAFLKDFGGAGHVIRMSRAIEVGDVIKVTEGPLQGREVLIQAIDRHKRTAFIQMMMFGSLHTIRIGLEVVGRR